MRKIHKIINIALIFMLIGGGPAYSADTSCLRAPFKTQDISQNRKILISQIRMSVMEYKRKEEHYPLITDKEIFSDSVLKEMEKLGVKVYREGDDCIWIYSEVDDYYVRLSKKSKYIYFSKKKTEEEILTRKEIETIERTGAAIRVFKGGHDVGNLFGISHDLSSVFHKIVHITISLDEHTEHFKNDLVRIASDAEEIMYRKINKIISEPAALSKEGTLTALEAKNAIQFMGEMLEAIKKDRHDLELIYKQFRPLYKGEEGLFKYFEDALFLMNEAIKILESRVEIATGASVSHSPQSIEEIIEEISSKNPIITIENNLPEDMIVNGNYLTLTNAITNLISNAVYFAKEAHKDKAEVKVILREEKGQIRIDIIDNGEGIPKDMLEIDPITGRRRLFRVNVSGRKGGTGLGTTDAWYAIKDHGGTIDVQSELGKGTTFTITLPVAEHKQVHAAEDIFPKIVKDREALETARMIDEVGIGPNDNVLSIGPCTWDYSLTCCAIRGGKVDVVQPPLWSKEPQTQKLHKIIEHRRKAIMHDFGEDLISGRIDLESYRSNVEDADLPRNHYSYVLLMNVMEIIDDEDNSKALIKAMLPSLKDKACILMSSLPDKSEVFEQIEFLKKEANKLGYKLDIGRRFKGEAFVCEVLVTRISSVSGTLSESKDLQKGL